MGGQGARSPGWLVWERNPQQKRESRGAEPGQEEATHTGQTGPRTTILGGRGPEPHPGQRSPRSQSFQGREAPTVSPPGRQRSPRQAVSGLPAGTSAASSPGHQRGPHWDVRGIPARPSTGQPGLDAQEHQGRKGPQDGACR